MREIKMKLSQIPKMIITLPVKDKIKITLLANYYYDVLDKMWWRSKKWKEAKKKEIKKATDKFLIEIPKKI